MQLKELEDYLEGQDVEGYDLFEEQEQEHRLWLDQRAIHIPEYNIKIREGICETWDMENQQYEVDHTFYMIFNSLTGEYLYTEAGSGMCVSLHNFLSFNNQENLSHDELLDLPCEVYLI